MNERRTNVDIKKLARSPLVRRYMVRFAAERFEATGEPILIVELAKAAAAAFDLHDEEHAPARPLLEVAAQVVAVELMRAGR